MNKFYRFDPFPQYTIPLLLYLLHRRVLRVARPLLLLLLLLLMLLVSLKCLLKDNHLLHVRLLLLLLLH